MPARDGTGPLGTGRGMGRHGVYGRTTGTQGIRMRDGSCRYPVNEKDALFAEKRILESRLKLIDQRLGTDSDPTKDQPDV